MRSVTTIAYSPNISKKSESANKSCSWSLAEDIGISIPTELPHPLIHHFP